PDAATLDAFVTAEANVKRGWSVAERFVGQLADDGVANDPVAAAPSAPVISSVWLAFQDGLLPGDVLAGAGQIEGVESAECRKVRGRESRLGHVEVFRMDCVRTSIIGRPRRLSAQRRAVSWNHRSTLSFTKSLIASPMSNQLMNLYGGGAEPENLVAGLTPTFITLGIVYAVVIAAGAFVIRVPHPDWAPKGFDPSQAAAKPMQTKGNVSVRNAIRTPQFWFLWVALF